MEGPMESNTVNMDSRLRGNDERVRSRLRGNDERVRFRPFPAIPRPTHHSTIHPVIPAQAGIQYAPATSSFPRRRESTRAKS